MKTRITILFLLLFVADCFGQVPAYRRQAWTTNTTAYATNGLTNVGAVIHSALVGAGGTTLSTNAQGVITILSAGGGLGDDVYINHADVINPNFTNSAFGGFYTDGSTNVYFTNWFAAVTNALGYFPLTNTFAAITNALGYMPVTNFATGDGVTNVLNLLSANLKPGLNITFTTNAYGEIEITGSAGGSGDVTALNTLTNAMPVISAGAKTIYATNTSGYLSAISAQPYDAQLVEWSEQGTNSVSLGSMIIGSVTIGTTNVVSELAGKQDSGSYQPADAQLDEWSAQSTNSVSIGELSVTNLAYGISWSGSLLVPTRDAVYDQIELLSSGSGDDVFVNHADITHPNFTNSVYGGFYNDGSSNVFFTNWFGGVTNALGYFPLTNTFEAITNALGYFPITNTFAGVTNALGYFPQTNTFAGITNSLGYFPQTNTFAGVTNSLGYFPVTNTFAGITNALGYFPVTNTFAGVTNSLGYFPVTNTFAGITNSLGYFPVTNTFAGITNSLNYFPATNTFAGITNSLGYFPVTNTFAGITNALGYFPITNTFAGITNALGAAMTGTGNFMRTRTGVPREIWIAASAMNPTNATAPGYVTNTWSTATDTQQLECYDFDSATEESVQFTLALPTAWDASTVKAKFVWKQVTASSATNVWAIAGGSLTDNETGGNTLGTAVVLQDVGLNDTNKVAITAATAAITIGGTPSAGHFVWFKVYRDADSAEDNMTGDARLIGVHLQYTETTTEPSAW